MTTPQQGGGRGELHPAAAEAVERLAYTTFEAAAAVGVSRAHIYNEMARGNLPSVALGRTRRIMRDDLLAWCQRNRTGAA